MALLIDFYRWLEAQDEIWVGRTELTDVELGALIERYLATRRAVSAGRR